MQAGVEEAYISLLGVVEDTVKTLPDARAPEPEEGAPDSLGNAAQEGILTTERKELPWTRSSRRIKSPSLRLHNGGLLQRETELLVSLNQLNKPYQ